ncbi:MAG: leucyl aminopeptidase [Acidaminococcaceae bacterium]
MLNENKEQLTAVINPVWETYNEQSLAAADVIFIFATKEEIQTGGLPCATMLTKLAAHDAKLGDAKYCLSTFLDQRDKLQQLFIMGLGAAKALTATALRKLAGEAGRIIAKTQGKIVIVAPSSTDGQRREVYLGALAEGLLLGAYEFTECKSKLESKVTNEIHILTAEPSTSKFLDEAGIVGECILWTRNLVNRPGNLLKPIDLAYVAEEIATENALECTVLDKTAMTELGMGALLAVAQGSAAEPQLIMLKYQGTDPEQPYLAFVGKGITFDSGGISIKPEAGMGEMKDDMAGAAAVLGAMKAISTLQLPCNIIAIAACAENMPSGTATRPGDVVTAANGKTIEVVSTDAEGRMVLADAVWYACRQGASQIIDIATLTGAVIIALGNETAGIVSNDDALCARIIKAGQTVGESYWQLPALPECREALKSDVADLLNSTGRPGGTITGGLFISEFVDANLPWAHIDIGGTATAEKTKGFWVKGATGMGVATLVQLAKEV